MLISMTFFLYPLYGQDNEPKVKMQVLKDNPYDVPSFEFYLMQMLC